MAAVAAVETNGTSKPKHEKLDRLHAAAVKNVWSMDSWLAYLNEALQKTDLEIGRTAFETVLSRFPTSTHATISTSSEEEKKESRRVITEAFEFVLTNVGHDKDAGSIWLDYLQFVKAWEAGNTYEEQQRMDQSRKIYHRALAIPLSNVETIWKDYDNFENGLNKITAKKLLSEKSSIYMTSRSAYRDLKNRMNPIDQVQKTWHAVPPSWTPKELEILDAWKDYLSWERSNPLNLEDNAVLIARIMFSFKSALLMMRHYPEIWYAAMVKYSNLVRVEASEYLLSIGKPEEAVGQLAKRNRSPLLTFTLCEIEETLKKDTQQIVDTYETLLKHLEDEIESVNARYDEERKEFLSAATQHEPGDDNEADWDGERREREREKLKELEKEVEVKVELRRKEHLDGLKAALTISWIVLMRFTRRSQNIRAAREIFKKGRKSPHCKHHLYIASALMEYYCSKDVTVATKVFEAGLKAYTDEESLAALFVRYLDFLLSIDDQNNARAVFERALSSLKPESCGPIWSRFMQHEINFGDLATLLKTEKRRMEVFAEDELSSNRRELLAERWAFYDLNYVAVHDLGLHETSRTTKGKVLKKGDTKKSGKETPADKYPRPDFSKWTHYKPEPSTTIPAPSTESMGGETTRQSQSSASSAPIPSGPTLMIPEAIVRFLELLPPPHLYNGPLIPAQEIVELLSQVPLPPPATPPSLVPVPLLPPPPHIVEQQRLMDSGSMMRPPMGMGKGHPPPMGGGRGDRSGGRSRGAGRGGFKRRGGRGSDDEDYYRGGGGYPDHGGFRGPKRPKLPPEEYLRKANVTPYFEDVIAKVLEEKPERPLKFLYEYLKDEMLTARDFYLIMDLLMVEASLVVAERVAGIVAFNAQMALPHLSRSSKTELDIPVRADEFVRVFTVFIYYFELFEGLERIIRECFSSVQTNRLVAGADASTPFTEKTYDGVFAALTEGLRLSETESAIHPWPSQKLIDKAIQKVSEDAECRSQANTMASSVVYFSICKQLFEGGLDVVYPPPSIDHDGREHTHAPVSKGHSHHSLPDH
ncbi:mRNA 3'-end-processing protein rna14 [Phlyctochytrium bullatum]|nr:mRNA 3'-end-processing protein rna14 [Phlyctochytrium bullatum]